MDGIMSCPELEKVLNTSDILKEIGCVLKLVTNFYLGPVDSFSSYHMKDIKTLFKIIGIDLHPWFVCFKLSYQLVVQVIDVIVIPIHLQILPVCLCLGR
jgi:hypothetical protein